MCEERGKQVYMNEWSGKKAAQGVNRISTRPHQDQE